MPHVTDRLLMLMVEEESRCRRGLGNAVTGSRPSADREALAALRGTRIENLKVTLLAGGAAVMRSSESGVWLADSHTDCASTARTARIRDVLPRQAQRSWPIWQLLPQRCCPAQAVTMSASL